MSDDAKLEVELLDESEGSEVLAELPSDQYYIRNKLWHLERLHNGRYKISARGDPTNDINKLLYALLIDKEKAEEWVIRKRGRQGHRIVYTIQKADGEGWVKQIEHGVVDPQVAVRHLRATTSIPPQYEVGALWNIQPLVVRVLEE